MPKSFNYKSNKARLLSYGEGALNSALDKSFLKEFLKCEANTLEELAVELNKITPSQKYMGLVFAKIFNLILKINHSFKGGSIISYNLLNPYNFKEIKSTVYALNGLDISKSDANSENVSGVMYMKKFLEKNNCRSYLSFNHTLSLEVEQFWVEKISTLFEYDKYFSSNNGSFTSEACLYVNSFLIFLEKLDISRGLFISPPSAPLVNHFPSKHKV